jgi:hypothetical protein
MKMRMKAKTIRSKKERAEVEKLFLSSVLALIDRRDLRRLAQEYGITWRRFTDRRHQALSRAIETIDFQSAGERMDIILDETYKNAPEYVDPAEVPEGYDPAAGAPGTAMRNEYYKKVEELTSGRAWLERELEAAGLILLVGGKVYLRGLIEAAGVYYEYDGIHDVKIKNVYEPSGYGIEEYARRLGFIRDN